jgi:UDPglucose 6-dehydrogenase
MNLQVSFIGMTHLGLCSLAAASDFGIKVFGFDKDEKKIKKIKKNQINFYEPKLITTIKKNKSLISFTSNLKEILQSDLVYIAEDVPTDNHGRSNTKQIEFYLNDIIKHLPKQIPIIILSQVRPGFTRKYFNRKKEIYYQVETLVFGNAIERAKNPERIIIGSNDKLKTKINKNYLTFLKLFKSKIIKMNYESAELSKISINAFLMSSLTTTNLLSKISEKINADWNDIIPALFKDKRIGKYAYIKSGLGISGGNLERDLFTLNNIINNNKIYLNLIASMQNISMDRKNWPNKVLKYILDKYKLKNNLKIGVLGISYKENTSSVKNSASLNFFKKLSNDTTINVYDPIVKKVNITKKLNHSKSIIFLIKNSDLIFILTPWKDFQVLNKDNYLSILNKKFVIDPYGIIRESNTPKIKHYFRLGKKYV